jgi:hypothetical protein
VDFNEGEQGAPALVYADRHRSSDNMVRQREAVPMSAYFLCSYRPLRADKAGRTAIRDCNLPPFIDGACRREPDLQATAPSISALCRTDKFAPRLDEGDYVAYITGQGRYEAQPGWALVALLRVIKRFESHEMAADWYRGQGYPLPSNCMVPGNLPQPYQSTNRRLSCEVLDGIDPEADPQSAVRLWDGIYQRRARDNGVFLACQAVFLELWHPPILRRSDLQRIFGRVPGTQNPPKITSAEFDALAALAQQRGSEKRDPVHFRK